MKPIIICFCFRGFKNPYDSINYLNPYKCIFLSTQIVLTLTANHLSTASFSKRSAHPRRSKQEVHVEFELKGHFPIIKRREDRGLGTEQERIEGATRSVFQPLPLDARIQPVEWKRVASEGICLLHKFFSI